MPAIVLVLSANGLVAFGSGALESFFPEVTITSFSLSSVDDSSDEVRRGGVGAEASLAVVATGEVLELDPVAFFSPAAIFASRSTAYCCKLLNFHSSSRAATDRESLDVPSLLMSAGETA